MYQPSLSKQLAKVFGLVVCAVVVAQATETPKEPTLDSTVRSVINDDGSADMHMTPDQVQTCMRGDGCTLLTNRQLKTMIERLAAEAKRHKSI